MIKGLESVTLFSQSAKNLAEFYKTKVGLKVKFEAVMGDKGEEYYDMEVGKGVGFGIVDHSKVKGKSKEPERIIFNLDVDDIEKEVKRLKKNKVKLVKDIYHIEGYGYIATFADVDGNFFQFVQVRATPKKK